MKVWLPIFLVGGLIFYFSSQPYSKQSLIPFLESVKALDVIGKYFSTISFHYSGREVSVAALGTYNFIEFFIRKGAHFFIFFLLGFLTIRALYLTFKKKRRGILIALIFVGMYAAFDEFHQSLTGGRTPLIEDVMLDSLGGMFGIIVGIILYYLKK